MDGNNASCGSSLSELPHLSGGPGSRDPGLSLHRIVVEVAVDSVTTGVAAVDSGADRLEVCRDLSVGGLTPDPQWIVQLKRLVAVPVVAMVRPRPGSFSYSPAEIDRCAREAQELLHAGADGLVCGILREDHSLDETAFTRMVALAGSRSVTFHRAFDKIPTPLDALIRLTTLGVGRILTSGGPARAIDGVNRLAQLVEQAGARLTVIAGGGVRADHVAQLVARTGVSEVHLAGAQPGEPGGPWLPAPGQVRAVVAALARG